MNYKTRCDDTTSNERGVCGEGGNGVYSHCYCIVKAARVRRAGMLPVKLITLTHPTGENTAMIHLHSVGSFDTTGEVKSEWSWSF
jgi:hypothetical protein